MPTEDDHVVYPSIDDWRNERGFSRDTKFMLPAFTCPRCGTMSWNPNDGVNQYCGRCRWWTGDSIIGHVVPPDMTEAKQRIQHINEYLDELHPPSIITRLLRRFRRA